MKKLITNYSFNAATRQVAFTDYSSVDLDGVLLITNVTDNVIIYNFSDPAFGGSVLGNVLTLTYNTANMSNSDALQIFYDDGAEPASDATATALLDVAGTLKRISKNMESLQVVDSNQRQRVNVESIPGVAVTNINAYGSVDPRWQIIDWARAAADSLRTKLTFT
jgi:hypothetical protein